jgi:hypothetical protein
VRFDPTSDSDATGQAQDAHAAWAAELERLDAIAGSCAVALASGSLVEVDFTPRDDLGPLPADLAERARQVQSRFDEQINLYDQVRTRIRHGLDAATRSAAPSTSGVLDERA